MEKGDYCAEDTGKIEMERIIKCLQENNYTLKNVTKAKFEYGHMVAKFEKDINYSDAEGCWINDRQLEISIKFDCDFDYQTNYKTGEEGDVEVDTSKGYTFIKKIMDDTTK